MTDLQLLNEYLKTCLEFINPKIFREIGNRQLTQYIEKLPSDYKLAKAIVCARLAKSGKYIGEKEIEEIADVIARLEFLRKQFAIMNIADVNKTLSIIAEMNELSKFIESYYARTS